MKINFLIILYIIVSLVFSVSDNVYAHPGNTAADGCHYCRTNCAKWGEVAGARHCHGGGSGSSGSAPAPAPAVKPAPKVYSPPPQPTCPQNSVYNSTEQRCICNYGYTASLNGSSCVKIPENAHVSSNGVDVWECNDGYEEVGNTCQYIEPIPEPVVELAPIVDITGLDESVIQVESQESIPNEDPDVANEVNDPNLTTEVEKTELTPTETVVSLGVLGGMVYGAWWIVKKSIMFVKNKFS